MFVSALNTLTGALFMDDCGGDSRVVARQSSDSSQGDKSLPCVKCFDQSGFVLHCHFRLLGDSVGVQAWV